MNSTLIAIVQIAAFTTGSAFALPGGGSAGHVDDWSKLDADLSQLAAAHPEDIHAPKIGGYMKVNFVRAPDVKDAFGNSGAGFVLNGVWIDLSGKIGDKLSYYFGISGTNSKGQTTLRDAYVTVPIVKGIHATVGQSKPQFLYSATVSRSKNLFLERTDQGQIWSRRDTGVIVTGHEGFLHWNAGVQNGGDGASEQLLYEGKVGVDLWGKGIDAKQEGDYGPDSKPRCTTAVSVMDDDSVTGGSVAAAELEGAIGRFFVAGEVVKYGSGWVKKAASTGAAKGANGLEDTTPYDFEAACTLMDTTEFALRYQNLNDAIGTRKMTYGFNWYVHGHAYKWQLDWVHTDNRVQHLDVYELGLTLAF